MSDDEALEAPEMLAPGSSAPGGGKLNLKLGFIPINIAVLTISDTRTDETDTSGDVLERRVADAGHILAARAIVPDDILAIQTQIKAWVASGTIDAIITTGGTGLTGRDVTPEAVEPLFNKRIDGFSVMFHTLSYASVGLSTLQSRALAGIIDGIFIFCLPGSNGAVKDGWDKLIKWQLDSRHRPCNMVELMPRLLER
jgi:molybdopterin adenylyltransferase